MADKEPGNDICNTFEDANEVLVHKSWSRKRTAIGANMGMLEGKGKRKIFEKGILVAGGWKSIMIETDYLRKYLLKE